MQKKERHYYVITTPGPISVLGGIAGPVKVAVEMTPYMAYRCVSEGHIVFEVNPYDHREKVRVTKANFNRISFSTTKVEMIKKKRMLEEIRGIKREPKLGASKKSEKDKKEEAKKKREENEGKADIDLPTPVVEEQAFKVTDFEKQ